MRYYLYIAMLCCSMFYQSSSAQVMIYKTSPTCNDEYLEMIRILETAQDISTKYFPGKGDRLNSEEEIAILKFVTGQQALPPNHVFFEREGYNKKPGMYYDWTTGDSVRVTKKDLNKIAVPEGCFEWHSIIIAKRRTGMAAHYIGDFYTARKEPLKALPYLKLAGHKYFYERGCGNAIIMRRSEIALSEMRCYEQLGKIDIAIDTAMIFGFNGLIYDSHKLISEFIKMLERHKLRDKFKLEVQEAIENATLEINADGKKLYYIQLRGHRILAAVNPQNYVDKQSDNPIDIIKDYSIYSRL